MKRSKSEPSVTTVAKPTALVGALDAIRALLDSPDLDLGGTVGVETTVLRDKLSELLAAAAAEHFQMLRDFAEIGKAAIDAFNEDSGDAESSALKSALDTSRKYAPDLPPDDEQWTI